MRDPQCPADSDGQIPRRAFLASCSVGLAVGALHTARAADPDDAANDPPLRVCLVSGSLEYRSDASLASLQTYLEARYPVRCTRAFRRTDDDLPGLENLATSDAAIFFTRRLTISGEQLQRVKDYCQSGRAIVGVRTASHGFQNWLAMDKEVFGGDYGKHYANDLRTQIELVPEHRSHPILQQFEPFKSRGSLYRNHHIADDTTLLLQGRIPEHVEPLAWTRDHHQARVFYTSLGHPDDFEIESFRRLLAHALLWTTRRIS